MARHVAIVGLFLALFLAAPVTAQDEDIESALETLRTALGDSESDSTSVSLLKEFLGEYPDTKYTGPVLGAIAYYQGEAMGDHPGAIAYIEAHIATLEDQDNIKASKIVLGDMYDTPEYKDRLKALVAELDGFGDLRFNDYTSLIFSAFGTEDWELAGRLVGPAKDRSTPDAVKEDYPDAPEEKVAERSAGRLLDLDVYEGWALANTGGRDEAIELFQSAQDRAKADYFGVPEGMLNVYWGKTLMLAGDNDGALEKLLPMALWGGSETAVKAVKEIFEQNGGTEAGFDDYLFENRVRHARAMDSFAAVDYKGAGHESKDLMGKVTLIAFWFPT